MKTSMNESGSPPADLTEALRHEPNEPGADHRLPTRTDASALEYPWAHPPAIGEVVEIAHGIGWLRMPLPWGLDHINLYLLPDGAEGEFALVDTGIRSKETKAAWRRLVGTGGTRSKDGRIHLTRLLLTHHHPDHLGLAGWFADRYGLKVHASRVCWLYARTLWFDKAPEVPAEVLEFFHRAGFSPEALERLRAAGWGRYREGVERLPIGVHRIDPTEPLKIGGALWWAIETAGHAPGHLSFFDPKRRLLVSGDQVLPEISSNVSVYPSEPFGNPLAEWLEGLARLRALPADTLVLPAHNRPFRGLHPRLDQLIGKHVERLGGVAEMCREQPRAAVEIFPALYRRRVAGMEYMMATGEALAHLHFLEAEGVLAREPDATGAHRFVWRARYQAQEVVERLAKITRGQEETAPWTSIR
ncbi:MAG: MBL fold metallo-hydrolase [Alphaproteobacteria bacterium]|nr:MAG: MBL fold metallo-hydrolase [Alphaproteobacteria bacterium]